MTVGLVLPAVVYLIEVYEARTGGGPGPVLVDHAPPAQPLRPGVIVSHDTFGEGQIVSVEGSGDRLVATVDFGTEAGTKRLLCGTPHCKLPGHDAGAFIRSLRRQHGIRAAAFFRRMPHPSLKLGTGSGPEERPVSARLARRGIYAIGVGSDVFGRCLVETSTRSRPRRDDRARRQAPMRKRSCQM